jgi:hypothetical protein
MGNAMQQQRLQPRVAKHDLKPITGSRVTLKNNAEISN